jgi:RimJ/RimL family protein N-acetyltransferase
MSLIRGVRLNDLQDATKAHPNDVYRFNPLVDQCIARVTPEGNVLGRVVYSDYTGPGGSIKIHITSWDKRWVNRGILFVAFDYPFNQLQVKKIFGEIKRSDEETLRFAFKAGFKAEAGLDDVYPNDDMVIVAMYRADCRFLGLPPRHKVH